MSISQYLARYADDVIHRAPSLQGPWQHVVVVPALGESPAFVDQLAAAAAGANAPCLLIVVVNATDATPAAMHLANSELLDALSRAHDTSLTVVSVDRSSTGHRLPHGQGVGLARRIGCDLALALIAANAVTTPWIHLTDADAALPGDYFTAPARHPDAVALTYRFRHLGGEALALYDLSLRYYVEGLRWAGSSYAHHTIGSTLAVTAGAYAAVRGVPLRTAGEDFYLVNKLAKVGRIATPATAPVLLAERASCRVPFGTAPATRRIAEELAQKQPFCLYHPGCFARLQTLLAALDAAAAGAPLILDDPYLQSAAEALGIAAAVADARGRTRQPTAMRRRLRDWFDGFRTLKLIHALRDAGLANQPWRLALAEAPWADAALREATPWLRQACTPA